MDEARAINDASKFACLIHNFPTALTPDYFF